MASLLGLAVALSGVGALLVCGGYLYFRQYAFVFRPRPLSSALTPAHLRIAYEDLYLTTASGLKLHGWWAANGGTRAIIYFHGSDGNLEYELPTLSFLRQFPASVLMIDYPGYGRSEGPCGEQVCYEAAESAWAFILGEKTFRPDQVILFGQSLGSAIGAYLAAGRDCGGLVFQSGFTSIPDMAARAFPYLPVRYFCRTKFDSVGRIAGCRCPVLILHSRVDEHIPVEQALRVYARVRGPKKFVDLRRPHRSMEWRRDPAVLAAWGEMVAGRTQDWEVGESVLQDASA
jgi:pimeloyl-ACP methyl ester carboxylesterase